MVLLHFLFSVSDLDYGARKRKLDDVMLELEFYRYSVFADIPILIPGIGICMKQTPRIGIGMGDIKGYRYDTDLLR